MCRLPRGALSMIEDVARHLRPAPRIAAAADSIVSALHAAGPYNGIHLRMEADAQYQDLVGGTEARRCLRVLHLRTFPAKRYTVSQSLTTLMMLVKGRAPAAGLTQLTSLGSAPVQAAWRAYFQSMRSAGFDSLTPLYVASGLLTYMNASGTFFVIKWH